MKNSTEQDLDILEDAMTHLHRAMSRHRMWEHITTAAGVSIDRSSAMILHFLEMHEKNHCHPSELASKLGVEAPSVTRKIQQLEEAGLVSRQPDPQDRRAFTLHITRTGRNIVQKIHKAKRQNLADVLGKWPPGDRHNLAILFQKLARQMADKHYQSISSK
jgi:DNA-binding MarR family transcriptional regulator